MKYIKTWETKLKENPGRKYVLEKISQRMIE